VFQTYRPTDSTNVSGLVLLLVVASVAGALAAFVYQAAVEFIPLIYVVWLATVGFGMGLGILVGRLALALKARPPAAVLGVLLVVVLAADAASFWWKYWIDTTRALSSVNTMREKAGLPAWTGSDLRAEMSLADYLDVAVKEGFRVGHVGSTMSGGGAPMSGVVVYLVWAFEAGAMFFFARKKALPIVDLPFFEEKERWGEPELLGRARHASIESLRRAAAAGDLAALVAPAGEADEAVTADYVAHVCPGVDEGWLSVVATWTAQVDGKTTQASQTVVRYARVTSVEREKVRVALAQRTAASVSRRKSAEAPSPPPPPAAAPPASGAAGKPS
jgi:hypothetical protein